MNPKTFDPKAIKDLLGHSNELIIKVYEEIDKGSWPVYEKLIHNYENQNWSSLKANAHFLKSNFRYLGNLEMFNILKTIENISLDETKRVEIPILMDKFSASFAQIMSELKEYLIFLKK
ncbi:MAG: hypothetical protein NW207_00465 [Cytophagales bacterium]|nr:hypothetical protein [Cytophagales bacterium]